MLGKGPLELPFANPALLPSLQMTQAWLKERASKREWGMGPESMANAEEKAPPITCI